LSASGKTAQLLGGLTLDHIGIVVPNLGAAIAFYQTAMGCAVSEPVVLPDHDIEVVFVELANTRIELIAPIGRIDPPRSLLGPYRSHDLLSRQPMGGIHHACYRVKDLAAALAELAEKGVRPLGDGVPVTGASGLPIIFLDPATTGGSLVELKQYS
jgi:methylmalonyl-CoA/ethylmalonyl-CoA epimerase